MIRYATCKTWAEYFKKHEGVRISDETIRKRLNDIFAKAQEGVVRGRVRPFFSEQDVRKACTDLLSDLPEANESGFLYVGKTKHGTIAAWARELGVTDKVIVRLLKASDSKTIKGRLGNNIFDFYAESNIIQVCDYLKLPKENENHFIEIGGLRYQTISALSKALSISDSPIVSRLEGLESVRGRAINGQLATFYPVDKVRERCADLLVECPMAGEGGFIIHDGVRFGTKEIWSKEIGIHTHTITMCIGESSIVPLKGRSNFGAMYDYYSEVEIRAACARYLQVPESKNLDFVEVDGVRFKSVFAFAKEVGVYAPAILKRIKNKNIRSIKAKDGCGRVKEFFAEDDLRASCLDLIESLPKADQDGFIVMDGIRWGTANALERELKISSTTILKYAKIADCPNMRGRYEGRICIFYPEPAVRKACANILHPMPKMKKVDFLILDGVRHGAIKAWSRELDLHPKTILSRLCSSAVVSVKAKDLSGQTRDVYPEPMVRAACADLLDPDLPSSGEDGFADIGGIRHGTVMSFTRILGISHPPIRSRLSLSGIVPVRGKDKSGNLVDLYPEPAIRELCADLLQPMPKADETGFFFLEDVRYGTLGGWSRELGISASAFESRIRLAGIQAVKGKTLIGHIENFYPKSTIIATCKDLLRPMPQADEFGFFVQDGIRHGTLGAWTRELGVPRHTIVRRVHSVSVHLLEGRSNKNGKIFDFYPEPAVRELCKDLLTKKPHP
jgi:hypothetical protein